MRRLCRKPGATRSTRWKRAPWASGWQTCERVSCSHVADAYDRSFYSTPKRHALGSARRNKIRGEINDESTHRRDRGVFACACRGRAVAADPVAVQLTIRADSRAQRSTPTSTASSWNTWAAMSTKASGWEPTPPFPTRAAIATMCSRRSRNCRCPCCAGPAAASPTNITGAMASALATNARIA